MASKNTIGSRIVIEGEKEYNEALRRIREEQKELRSEMKLCTETYKDNANGLEALQKKSEILTKQVDKQAEAVDNQRKKLEAAEKAQAEAGKKTEEYKEALEKAKAGLTQLESATDSSVEALENQRKEIEELETGLLLAQQEYAKTETATIKYSTALNNAEAEQKALEKELQNINGYLAEAEGSIDGCAKSIDQYGKQVKEATGETEDFGKKTESAVTALADAMVASGVQQGVEKIAESLMDCSEAAAEFELAMKKVYTIADESAVAQADMSSQLLESAINMRQSANEMASATYEAISAGVDTQDAAGFTVEATKLAVAGFTEVTTSVDILTTTLNAYNLEADQTARVSDMLVTTQNEGKTTVNELATNMGKVIPLAAAYNVNMANLSTTYAKLTANGIKTAEATTYIKAMLSELGDSGSKVAEVLGEETGKSFADLMNEGYSLGGVLDILSDNVEGDAGAFNELWSSSEAGIGALSLLGSGVKEFNRVLEAMNNSAGTTEEAFQQMTDSTEYAQQQMTVAVDNLKIAIGESLNPSINEFYSAGTDILSWATDFVSAHPEVVKAIATIAGGIGVATVAVTGITAAVAAFNTVMNATNPVILALSAALGLLVAGYAALSDSSESRTAELEAEAEALQANTEAQQAKIEATVAELEQQETQFNQTRDLIKKIVELNNAENLSALEKAELADRVKILNERMPSLTLEIDEQTGRLKENTEAFEEMAEAAVVEEELAAIETARTEAMNNLTAAEESLKEIEEERLELQEEMAEVQERRNELLEKAENGSAMQGGLLITEQGELIQLNEELALLEAREENLTAAMEAQSAVVAQAKTEYDALATSTNEVVESTETAEKVFITYKDAMHLVNADIAEDVNSLNEAYQNAKISAEDSLGSQVGLFEKLSSASDISVTEMAENLNSQTEVFNQYKEDLLLATEMVKKEILDEGLLGSIKELGIDGAGYLRELVAAAEESPDKFAELCASYEEMEAARTGLSETMADLETDYTKQMDALIGIHTLKYGELVTSTEDAYADMLAEVEEGLAALETSQTEGVSTMVTAVTEKYPDMKIAGEGLGNAAAEGLEASLVVLDDGSSEVFRNMGYKIPESVAQGIRDGQALISTAVQEVIDTAVSDADMSGLSARIDRMLGESFG